MKPFQIFLLALGVVALFCMPNRLHAQATKIFVASYGNDANDGSRGSPKRNFQAAHTAVADGGQIVVLDTAGYGALNISKSVAVTVPPGVNGFVTVSSSNANGISIAAPGSARVLLRGLIVEGGGLSGTGFGIFATSVGSLAIDDCTVRNFYEGIYVLSNVAAQVSVRHCTVRDCSYGLDSENSAAVGVVALVSECQIYQCLIYGVLALNNIVNGSVDVTLADCFLSGNVTALASLDTSTVLRVDNCRLTGNSFGTFTRGSGQLLSRGNNTLERSSNGNTFPGTYSAK
jgi:hypothetical protein